MYKKISNVLITFPDHSSLYNPGIYGYMNLLYIYFDAYED